MEIIHTITHLRKRLAAARDAVKSIGFVPTMGALHEGHLSLLEACRKENDVAVVSIFVNPSQFNNPVDLQTYPRTLEADCTLLEQGKCDYVFVPSEEEIYPVPDLRTFDYGTVTRYLEAQSRPGHFDGVLRVVSRLFEIVSPTHAYFGLKDYQQLLVVRELIRREGLPIILRPCPIVRHACGLACSSRNTRLSEEQFHRAAILHQTLQRTVTEPGHSPQDTKKFVQSQFEIQTDMQLEYFDIVNAYTLEPALRWEDTFPKVGLIALHVGAVRLIDNIAYNEVTF
ncbi:MAG: pantoate--beta-alanine ligase [Tannerellaceae bacterium]|jgi:pantoate--beta-alanine ligase|nr:pantoate--beta-alanine ligase [Tannerellaceae bacterium]